jgi:hypothetical protein
MELTLEEEALLHGSAGAVLEELRAERTRQVEEEGFNPKHDEAHQVDELTLAAAAYAFSAAKVHTALAPHWRHSVREWILQHLWPWWAEDFKPKSPRRDLVRAGALIVAAIERLDREDIQRGEAA